jgi:hypothetical protein
LILVVSSLALLAGGCAKVQANTEPAMPVLEPPPPPPRTVETYVDEPVETTAPSPAETALNSPPPRPAVRPQVPVPAAVTPPKPVEPPRIEPERPTTPPPALTLKPAAGGESATETSIRGLIANASRDLGRTNYTSLNADGRAQYDTAKRFMQQAEEALRGGNLVFAGKLADKAATMAAVLVR